MNFRLTAIVLGVLVVLGGLVWFSEFKDKDSTSPGTGSAAAKPSDKDKAPPPEIFKFEEKDIRQLEVARGEQRVQIQRDEGGNWTLQPSGQPGDRTRISGVMFRLTALQATRLIAEAATDLAQFGLDRPAVISTVSMLDGTSYGLETGGKAPTESGTYAKKSGESTVYLIPNNLVADLERLVAEPPVAPPTPTPAPTSIPTATPSG